MSKVFKTGVSIWLVIGVIVLIILLLLWLTIADLFGDTDVVAMLTTHTLHAAGFLTA